MNHIIRRQLLELVIDNKQQPFDLQNRLSEHYYQTLLPVLEKWFDQLAGQDEVLHVDKLVIDLGAFSTREFKDHLITERLTQKLSSPEMIQAFGTASKYSAETHTSDPGDRSRGRTSSNSVQRGNDQQGDGATFRPGHDTGSGSGSGSGTSEKDAVTSNANLTGGSGATSGQGVTDNSGTTSGSGSNSANESGSTDMSAPTDRSASVPGTGSSSGAGSNADPRPGPRDGSASPNDKGPISFIRRRTPGQNAFEQWLWYMGKGYLPWNLLHTGKEWEDNVLETLAIDYDAISRLRMILPSQPVTLARIVRQQDHIFLTKLVEILTSMAQPALTQNLQRLQSPALPLEKLWQDTLLLAAALNREGTTQQLVLRLTHTSASASSGETALSGTASSAPGTGSSPADGLSLASNPSPVTGSSSSSFDTTHTGDSHAPTPIANLTVDELPGEGLFIGNAGVILTHPFLNHLFKLTDLTTNGRFIDEQHRQKAIHLIHYLATGSTSAEEHELAIAKILCACPLQEPMEKQLVWTPEELQHADTLLEGLISHWGVKGVTPEGLRGNFLTRNGKIYTRSDKIYLTIEQHAVDILIRTYPLPWNMSFIKLPWFKQAIHLDW